MSENLNEINDAEFKTKIASGLSLVDFWAPWCGPCRMQTPILEKLATKTDGKVNIYKLNVDENPQTAGEFGVMSIPTLILFKDGQPVNQFVGVQPEPVLEKAIAEVA